MIVQAGDRVGFDFTPESSVRPNYREGVVVSVGRKLAYVTYSPAEGYERTVKVPIERLRVLQPLETVIPPPGASAAYLGTLPVYAVEPRSEPGRVPPGGPDPPRDGPVPAPARSPKGCWHVREASRLHYAEEAV